MDIMDREPFSGDEPEGHKEPDKQGVAELVYGVLFSPATVFRRVSKEPPLFLGFGIFLTATVLSSLVNTLAPRDFTGAPAELAGALAGAAPFIGILAALAAIVGWFIQAGVFQLFAEFMGGKGRAIEVLVILALIELPKIVITPFRVIGYLYIDSFAGRFLGIAASLVAAAWWVVLLVIGLREVQRFSTGRAVAVLLLPFAAVGLVLVVFAVSLAGIAAPFLDSVF